MRNRTVKRKLQESTEDRRQMKQLAGILWSWLIRQPKKCLKCGKESPTIDDFDSHHVLGRRGLLLYDLKAGVPLCHSCHRWGVHKDRASEAEWEHWFEANHEDTYKYLTWLKIQLAVNLSMKFVINDLLAEVERLSLSEEWAEYAAQHPVAQKLFRK